MIFLFYIEVMIDKEIILKAQNGDIDAMNKIIKAHHKLVYSIINNYSLNFSDYDLSKEDMYQEGLIGLYQAIKTYDVNKENKFITFAYPLIYRKIYKEYKRQYNRYLEEGFSYSKYDELDHLYNQRTTYISDNPVDYIDKQSRQELLFELIKDLKPIDKTIVKMRLLSYTYKEIATKLNVSDKTIDYHLRKIKKHIQDKNKNMN